MAEMKAPAAGEALAWLAGDGEFNTEDVTGVLPLVTSLAKAYTRGKGFDDDMCADEIRAVIYSVTARVLKNPSGLRISETEGPRSYSIAGWAGFTLLERQVLDRYRVKAL
ncbi:hypothetical protein [Propionimicrobium sp. PCR01-08-3]|uniref:hypothetical protein n=1 Tax=Propionimicrobium sp. PCR01-08-3 TaxID=3052086 RepID=UPI00255CCCAA|nr:hypothetical protein [Propionimicrobium sp. PCR01-08-3]WIY81383.1 hypothetical protein QQ658_07430 [Propionimicrobium sp. PCR01-08-3]WIY81770.1 hypothetical protein QQ658_09570 [Propionimicrobium sp. PCR01-08-3]